MQRGDQSHYLRIFWLKKGQIEERWENFIGELPEECWVKKSKDLIPGTLYLIHVNQTFFQHMSLTVYYFRLS